MYLSLKEIWHEKLRYGLIIAMILLVTIWCSFSARWQTGWRSKIPRRLNPGTRPESFWPRIPTLT